MPEGSSEDESLRGRERRSLSLNRCRYKPQSQPQAAGWAGEVTVLVTDLTHQLADCVARLDGSRDLSPQSAHSVGCEWRVAVQA